MVAQMEQNSYEKSIHVYLHINVVSEIYVWQKYLRVEKKCILKVYASQKLCLYFQKYMKTKPGLQVFFICVIWIYWRKKSEPDTYCWVPKIIEKHSNMDTKAMKK